MSIDDVETIAKAYRGYAKAVENSDAVRNEPWVGSSYLISASYFLLFDPQSAVEMFYSAALSYKKMQHPFWIVCGICSNNFDDLLNYNDLKESYFPSGNSESYFYRTLSKFYQSEDFFEPLESHQRLRGKIPGTDIPYAIVFDVMSESNGWESRINPKDLPRLSRFSELLRRAFEPTALSRLDNFHWKMLQGTVLPFDPQSVALVLTFIKKWKQHHNFNKLEEYLEANDDEKLILNAANKLLSNGD